MSKSPEWASLNEFPCVGPDTVPPTVGQLVDQLSTYGKDMSHHERCFRIIAFINQNVLRPQIAPPNQQPQLKP